MFRKYQFEDIDRIVEIESENLLSTLGFEFYLKDLDNPFSNHYVLEENNIIIGFISSYFDGDILEILNFCVDKKYQSKGYGSFIINELFKLLNPSSAILEVRNSNERAIHVYQKIGFKTIRIRKEYYSNGEDALLMQKIFD